MSNTPQWAQRPEDQPGQQPGPQQPGWGQPPPVAPKKDGNAKAGCFGCLGGLGLIVVVGIIASAASSGSNQAASPAAAPASSALAVAPSTPAADSTTPAAASTGLAVATWYSSGGKTHIDGLSGDLTRIGTDGANQDATSMLSDCATMSGDVSQAQAYDAIPDGQAQGHWSKALASLGQASSDCTRGVAATDAGLVTKAAGEITAATGELSKASARIAAISAAS